MCYAVTRQGLIILGSFLIWDVGEGPARRDRPPAMVGDEAALHSNWNTT